MPSETSRVGLCASCRHGSCQNTARGSEFWRCRLADRDPRFLRYPPLPVIECPGHAPGEPRRRAEP